MLLPNNIHPKDSLYFNGAVVLSQLLKLKKVNLFELYGMVNEQRNMTMPVFVLTLDWLYLADAAKVDEDSNVVLCI